jgi:hypothetical protein
MDVSELIGKTITKIDQDGNERLTFHTNDGSYAMFHISDCCESVYIEDIIGNLEDLIGTTIYMAEEVISGENPPDKDYESESFTWTFYKFGTVKGYVTIRWYGSSNGYYSESVTFEKLD